MMTVHWSDFRGPDSSKRFLLRRWLRIFPPYWVVTLVLALTFAVAPGMRHQWLGGHANVLLPLALIPQFDASADNMVAAPLLFVGWTPLYEMYFYYAFASALRLPLNIAVYAFAAWGIAVAAVRFVPAMFHNPITAFLSRALIIEFCSASASAIWSCGGASTLRLPSLGARVAMLLTSDTAVMGLLHGSWGENEGFRALGWGVGMACILYGAIGLEKRGKLFSMPYQRVGDAS